MSRIIRTLLISATLLPSAIGLAAGSTVNWTNQGYNAGIAGYNPKETTISSGNVQNLTLAWQSSTSDINGVSGLVEDAGKVYVESTDSSGAADVVALDISTGAELWKASLNGTSATFGGLQGMAAGSKRVFAPCTENTYEGICAFSRSSGKLAWFDTFYIQGVSDGGEMPRVTYAGGVLYVAEGMCDVHNTCNTYWALNAKNGSVIWGAPNPNGGAADPSGGPLSPAVSSTSDLAYIPCIYNYNGDSLLFSGLCTFDTSSGTAGWQYGQVRNFEQGGLQGGVSVSGKTVFFNEVDPVNNIDVLTALDASTGDPSWAFDSPFSYHDRVQPTVAGNRVFWPDGNGTLWAFKEKTGATLWSNSNWADGECSPVGGPNGTESQPQVANGVVFITTQCTQSGDNFTGTFALDATNGTVLWQGSAGYEVSVGGAAPMILNGALYSDCGQVCAWTLADGHRTKH